MDILVYLKPSVVTAKYSRAFAWQYWHSSNSDFNTFSVPAQYQFAVTNPTGLDGKVTKSTAKIDTDPVNMKWNYDGDVATKDPSGYPGPDLQVYNEPKSVPIDVRIFKNGDAICAIGSVNTDFTAHFTLDPKIYFILAQPGAYSKGEGFWADALSTEYGFDLPVNGNALLITWTRSGGSNMLIPTEVAPTSRFLSRVVKPISISESALSITSAGAPVVRTTSGDRTVTITSTSTTTVTLGSA